MADYTDMAPNGVKVSSKSKTPSDRTVVIGAWSGVVAVALYGLAIGPLAGMLPLPAENATPTKIAALFSSNRLGIGEASTLAMFAGTIFLYFIATISGQLRRIEKRSAPNAYTLLLSGGFVGLTLIFAGLLWGLALVHPERSPEITQAFNDFCCLMFVAPAPLGVLQNLPIAIAIYQDPNPVPLFPRWVAHVNIVTAIGYLPGLLSVFYFSGPLDWSGFTEFWVTTAAFDVWLITMVWALLQGAKRTGLVDPGI